VVGSRPKSIDAALGSDSFRFDPYPVYRRLLEDEPVHWSDPWNTWIVSKYADVIEGLRDEGKTFSVAGRVKAAIDTLPEDERGEFGPIQSHYASGLLHSDPPDHTRLRSLISKVFTPRVVEGMRPRIESIVTRLIDSMNGKSGIDVVRDFAFPLPATVVADLLGLPPEDRVRFKAWSDDIASFHGASPLTAQVTRHAQESLIEARAYLAELANQRRVEPRDDLISRLVAAQGGDALTDGELLSTCVTFMVGGHETTTALISSGLWLLFQSPEQLGAIRSDPSLIPAAVEEMLRYESPAQRSVRRLRSDTQIGGLQLRSGQTVMLLLGGANRDPDQFPDPDRFDATRNPNRHLAFAMGVHFCIGAPLARMEAQIALREILGRFPSIRPMRRDPDWLGNLNFRMLRRLPVVLS
jgi:cytochrome P450